MLAYTREQLSAMLLEVPALVNLYQRRDPAFVERTVAWLGRLEKTLEELRDPLAAYVATRRARVLAVGDGLSDPEVAAANVSKRRATLVAAYLGLAEADAAVRGRLERIDAKFETWREKMAQFLAVASNGHTLPLPPTEPRNAWLLALWQGLPRTAETQSMYNYLNTIMDQSDRLYLLDELIRNLLGV